MAVKWIEGFDLYNTAAQLSQRYTTNLGFPSFTTGRFTGSCLKFSGTAFLAFAPFSSATTQLSVGFAYMTSGVASGTGQVMFLNAGGSAICDLRVNTSGALVATRGGTTLGTSASGVIVNNTWAYIEVEFVRNASTGVFNVYVNGTQVLSLTGQNTGASDIDAISIQGVNNADHSFDDLYVTDTSTKLGERRVDTIRPSADTAQKDWTPSTGTNNSALVDETTFNDDTDYVSSSTVGNKDLYDLADLSFTPATVDAIDIVWRARKDDATTRTVRTNIKSGSTTSNGTTQSMSSTYNHFHQIVATDPDTAGAWSASSINALQAGPEVVS